MTQAQSESDGSMRTSFWDTLPKPFFVLAPMADVTDAAFRQVIAKYGRPDVTWTEFVSADGLARAPKTISQADAKKAVKMGKSPIPPFEKLTRDLLYTEAERPIVAQFFSSHPENMREAARIAREMGFDGIDINMGCPDKSIEKQGAGAAMMKNAAAARAVIRAAQEGSMRDGIPLPVSVKTRIGYNKDQLAEWLPELLAEHPAAITLHARTRKEMSKVPARWEHVAEAVRIRDSLGSKTLIIGNGDVTDIVDARRRAADTGCDGVMLGRAIFGNPWLFNEKNRQAKTPADIFVPTIRERLETMVEHTKLFEKLLGDIKNCAIMKKHYKAYVNNFEGAVTLRIELLECATAAQVEAKVAAFLKDI